jgi:hypothetical protein
VTYPLDAGGQQKGTQLFSGGLLLHMLLQCHADHGFAPAHTCFHVLNRAVARLTLFKKPEDYEAFERVLLEAWQRDSLPIYSYCLMSNHWHFVVCPEVKT